MALMTFAETQENFGRTSAELQETVPVGEILADGRA